MWLAVQSATDGVRTALVDLSGELGNLPAHGAETADGSWYRLPLNDALDALAPAATRPADDLLPRKAFHAHVDALLQDYDRVIFSASAAHAKMARRALHGRDFYLVAVCGKGKARRTILEDLRAMAPIDACLSEA